MHFISAVQLIGALLLPTVSSLPLLASSGSVTLRARNYNLTTPSCPLKPKVLIISLFQPEAEVWWNIPEFDILAQNISIPGLSPRFPEAHCTADGEICQVVTGEGEINAATTIQSLTLYAGFDLTETYFLSAGIAGVNPNIATLGSVTYARFAIQVAQQYEFDIRDIGDNFTTGYIPYGTTAPAPAMYPQNVYGTEVFELNVALRDRAVMLSSKAKLNDSDTAIAYRATYEQKAAREPPVVIGCDVATSDNYFSGPILTEAANNFTLLMTNGTGVYCTTAQEDNATLEALMRAAQAKKVDYNRIMIMRTASNFERPHPGESAYQHLIFSVSGGFLPSVANIYIAGIEVVTDITTNWDTIYAKGIEPTNYVGDIFGTLGGTPDFGPYPFFGVA
ncbi:purine nucleoside permease [Dothidotthia symphoricarpi CBS 119687]|uniref:Purine nucleoside permease n=1 Tax=Dothidotthia symphoricarpi CBS 119687 TaxID=1392245 RepID=A0A6A6AAR3_9PLEO|nr:purine nucleoside permease [Dothidotthia symphoricarpi CBS 119687]KAF2128656.1 purine nucleoside permease [Dothidotthia symphoricarpi CBS 119687]